MVLLGGKRTVWTRPADLEKHNSLKVLLTSNIPLSWRWMGGFLYILMKDSGLLEPGFDNFDYLNASRRTEKAMAGGSHTLATCGLELPQVLATNQQVRLAHE